MRVGERPWDEEDGRLPPLDLRTQWGVLETDFGIADGGDGFGVSNARAVVPADSGDDVDLVLKGQLPQSRGCFRIGRGPVEGLSRGRDSEGEPRGAHYTYESLHCGDHGAQAFFPRSFTMDTPSREGIPSTLYATLTPDFTGHRERPVSTNSCLVLSTVARKVVHAYSADSYCTVRTLVEPNLAVASRCLRIE